MPSLSCLPRRGLVGRTVLFTSLLATSVAAAPVKRFAVDQRGDFVLMGNTLGQDCAATVPAPLAGTVGNCGTSSTLSDSAPDVYWRSEDPDTMSALADVSLPPSQARSTAMLAIPPGATLTYARLYWGARLAGKAAADVSVTLDRPGGPSLAVTADGSSTAPLNADTAYHSTADVTDFVKMLGPGALRVSDVDSQSFLNLDDSLNFAAWSLVAFYELPTDPPRNLVIFDGLERVATGMPSSVSIAGFLVPAANSNARLGVVAYEGDSSVLGDSLLFNGNVLSDAHNPADNFFNSSRSVLGVPASIAGDLPRTSGLPGSLSGLDLDIVDITAFLHPQDTSATLQATSIGDAYYLATLVTSIATFKPDLTATTKTVVDLDGGAVLAGDTLEYTIVVPNHGNDEVQGLVLTDLLPIGLTYLPGSLQVTAGANAGPKTDSAGDDQGDYSAPSLTVRLGAGASALVGGTLGAGESTTMVFRARVDAGIPLGLLVNQATVAGTDKSGPLVWLSGNGATPGAGTTSLVEQCATDTNCPTLTPVCKTLVSPRVCVGCLLDLQCSGATPVCELSTLSCRGCLDTDPCGDPDKDGLTNAQEAAIGTDPKNPDSDGDSLLDGAEAPPGQTPPDSDGDGTIDALDDDDDNDGLPTKAEIALATASGQPADADLDGHSNWLDTDSDGDNKPDLNDGTTDDDGDGIPNFLDPKDSDGPLGDLDGDGLPNIKDNCPQVANPDQLDANGDGIGDACQSQGTGGAAGSAGAAGEAGTAGEGGAGLAGAAGEGGAGAGGSAGDSGQGGVSGNAGIAGQAGSGPAGGGPAGGGPAGGGPAGGGQAGGGNAGGGNAGTAGSGNAGGGPAGGGQAGGGMAGMAGMAGQSGGAAGAGQAGVGGGGKGGESGGAAGSGLAGAGGKQAGGAAQGGAGSGGKAGAAGLGGTAGKATDPDSEESLNFAGAGCSAGGRAGAGPGPAAFLGLLALLRGWRGRGKRRMSLR